MKYVLISAFAGAFSAMIGFPIFTWQYWVINIPLSILVGYLWSEDERKN